MKAPDKFTRIVNRTRYSVEASILIASDAYWDGNNMERHGRNTFLYRTVNGHYFTVTLTRWQGERDTLTPVTLDEAIDLYEGQLSEHETDYNTAFPGVDVEEA